ncbi:hypothetical protein C7974DRAFT_200963 [Boeremia exigua]|uniref:uncharacterized protein n=1 Tax=Boeremia exigua TaxID=749465 RepID=UPI001E8E8732|nr:uncharacterized protein C7974DRAFT_200963 [Boeremia exigua]KAH6625408.1 hypothetical protein C7974DRAFT_200963 [Boeremia exigua]
MTMLSTNQQDVSTIAQRVHNCLNKFQEALNDLLVAKPHIKAKLPAGGLLDELGRFRIWSGNVGAHRKGRGSLDFKLREASHIRERVVELVQDATVVLGELQALFTGARVPWEDLSDSDSDTSTSCSGEHQESTTELSQLLSNIAEINTCLMRLSMSIRNPAPHDQFKQSKHIGSSHYEAFDVEHVREKFPHAADYLVVRLGHAISRRRQFLRYREEHRRKYQQGLSSRGPLQPEAIQASAEGNLQLQPGTAATTSEEHQSTVASSIPWALKNIGSIQELDEHDDLIETLSQTTYAASTGTSTRLRPPPLPATGGDGGQPFECTVCFRITSVQDTLAWHKHVYRDLQPYVCTFQHCEMPDHTYESRHEWFEHESSVHRGYWECLEDCNKKLDSADSLQEHLKLEHPDLASATRVADLVKTCYRPAQDQKEAECILCQFVCPSLLVLRRHLGEHQEELSLFALPSYANEDNHETSDDEDSSRKSDVSRKLPQTTDIRCSECNLDFEGSAKEQRQTLDDHLKKILHSDATRLRYSSWRHSLNAYLDGWGMWDWCDGTNQMPRPSLLIPEPHEERELRLAWLSQDEQVKQAICMRLSEKLGKDILPSSSLKPYVTAEETLVALDMHWGMNATEPTHDGPMNEVRSSLESENEDPLGTERDLSTATRIEGAESETAFQDLEIDSDSTSMFNDRKPSWQEAGRLVEANGGSRLLDEHNLWANLGYDLDLGRELTESEITKVKTMNLLYNFTPYGGPDTIGEQQSPADHECITCDRRYAKQEVFTTLDEAMSQAPGMYAQQDWAVSKRDGGWKHYLSSMSKVSLKADLMCAPCILRSVCEGQRWPLYDIETGSWGVFSSSDQTNRPKGPEIQPLYHTILEELSEALSSALTEPETQKQTAINASFSNTTASGNPRPQPELDVSSPAASSESHHSSRHSVVSDEGHTNKKSVDPSLLYPWDLDAEPDTEELLEAESPATYKFECPVKKQCLMTGRLPDCDGLSTPSLIAVRQHLSHAPHRYTELDICKTCGQVFTTRHLLDAHSPTTCNIRKPWVDPMERWRNLYCALFPNVNGLPDPRNGWTSRAEAIAMYEAEEAAELIHIIAQEAYLDMEIQKLKSEEKDSPTDEGVRAELAGMMHMRTLKSHERELFETDDEDRKRELEFDIEQRTLLWDERYPESSTKTIDAELRKAVDDLHSGFTATPSIHLITTDNDTAILDQSCTPSDYQPVPSGEITSQPSHDESSQSIFGTEVDRLSPSTLEQDEHPVSETDAFQIRNETAAYKEATPSTLNEYRVLQVESKVPAHAVLHLEAWLKANKHHPYPNAETKIALAEACGISLKKVTAWFTNDRKRRLAV